MSRLDDIYYVLFNTNDARFMKEYGEEAIGIIDAARFNTLKKANEEKQKMDNPEDFFIFKVRAEFWLKRV